VERVVGQGRGMYSKVLLMCFKLILFLSSWGRISMARRFSNVNLYVFLIIQLFWVCAVEKRRAEKAKPEPSGGAPPCPQTRPPGTVAAHVSSEAAVGVSKSTCMAISNTKKGTGEGLTMRPASRTIYSGTY
jgi:hypothetical protein